MGMQSEVRPRFLATVTLMVLFLSIGLMTMRAAHAVPAYAYITDKGNDAVSVVDLATGTVVKTIAVGKQPTFIAASPHGRRVYVADSGGGTVSVISTATNRMTETMQVMRDPAGIAVSPTGRWIYVVDRHGGGMTAINRATDAAFIYHMESAMGPHAFPFPVAAGVTVGLHDADPYVAIYNSSAHGHKKGGVLAFLSPSEGRIAKRAIKQSYESSMLSDVAHLGKIAGTVGSLLGYGGGKSNAAAAAAKEEARMEHAVAHIPFSFVLKLDRPFDVVSGRRGTRLYVSEVGNNSIAVINTVPVYSRAVIGGVGKKIDKAKLQQLKIKTQQLAARLESRLRSEGKTLYSVANVIHVGQAPHGIATSPDGRWLYVANTGSNTVSVIDTLNDKITGTIAVGRAPIGLATDKTGLLVVVTNFGSNSVSVIDSLTGSVIRTVSLGTGTNPFGVVIP